MGHETLNLTSTLDGKLVSFRKLIHTENGNDILETLVILEEFLSSGGNVVVLLSDDTGVEHTRLGIERVDSGRFSNPEGETRSKVFVFSSSDQFRFFALFLSLEQRLPSPKHEK